MSITFIHGGADGAFRIDNSLVNRLANAIGLGPLGYPRITGLEKLEWTIAHGELREYFTSAKAATTVVAHSAGGVAMLKLLSLGDYSPATDLFLLASPYKAEDSHWGKDDFTFPNDFGARLRDRVRVHLYHSDDDPIIPYSDALLYREKLPWATLTTFHGYGHQFDGTLDRLAADIKSAACSRQP